MELFVWRKDAAFALHCGVWICCLEKFWGNARVPLQPNYWLVKLEAAVTGCSPRTQLCVWKHSQHPALSSGSSRPDLTCPLLYQNWASSAAVCMHTVMLCPVVQSALRLGVLLSFLLVLIRLAVWACQKQNRIWEICLFRKVQTESSLGVCCLKTCLPWLMCFFWLSFRVLQEDLQLSDSEESGDDQVSFRCFIPSAHRHPIKSSQLVVLLWAPKANLSFPSPICFLNKTGCWTATFFTWSSKVHVCSQTASLEEGGELCFFVHVGMGPFFCSIYKLWFVAAWSCCSALVSVVWGFTESLNWK